MIGKINVEKKFVEKINVNMIGLLLQRINVIKTKFMVTQFPSTLRINDRSLLKQRASENSPVLIMLTVVINLLEAS